MKKSGGSDKAFNSLPGRTKGLAQYERVQTIHIQDQERNLEPWRERVHPWTTVRELKEKIQKTTGYPVQRQRLFFNNNELENSKSLDFYNLLSRKNVVNLRLKPDIEQLNSYIDVYGSFQCPKNLKNAIEKIRKGFNSGLIPKLTDDGTSGAYILRNTNKESIAIFKPIDEEPFAPNNPRGHQGPFGSQTFRPGVLSGESCIREVAAYILDDKHFSGVPPTTFAECVHHSLTYVPFTGLEVTSEYYFDILSSLIKPVNQEESANDPQQPIQEGTGKSGFNANLESLASTLSISRINSTQERTAKRIAEETQIGMKFGSLQQFCDNLGPIENFSRDKFHKNEVHKIAILDLRLLNLDRNECNILVTTKPLKNSNKMVRTLIPIDHGLCIPDNLNVCSFDLAWLSWRHAEQRFSRKSLHFIESIDIMSDIKKLEETFRFRPICLRNFRISNLLLKRGAKAGLNLSQIGQILCRPDEDDTMPSLLERIVEKSRLIADMMFRMQQKIKDTNLRSIDQLRIASREFSKKAQDANFYDDKNDSNEEEKIGANPGVRQRNFRTNSLVGVSLNGISNRPKAGQTRNNQLFSSITAAIGVENDQYKVESKKRGMSDVDDTNIKQLKDNTYTMIDAQVLKMKQTTSNKNQEYLMNSPKQFGEISPESDEAHDNINNEQDNDEEFFDALDDKTDISILEEQMKGRNRGVLEAPSSKKSISSQSSGLNGGLRRTASFSNIQIQEAANEDEEDDPEESKQSKNQNINDGSPDKQQSFKLKNLNQNERHQRVQINPSRGPKHYFDNGSIRDTAHDEEFFHCFVQYLDEAIKKLKDQGDCGSGNQSEDDNGEEEEQEQE